MRTKKLVQIEERYVCIVKNNQIESDYARSVKSNDTEAVRQYAKDLAIKPLLHILNLTDCIGISGINEPDVHICRSIIRELLCGQVNAIHPECSPDIEGFEHILQALGEQAKHSEVVKISPYFFYDYGNLQGSAGNSKCFFPTKCGSKRD